MCLPLRSPGPLCQLLALLSLALTFAAPAVAQTVTGAEPVKIFILAGESNMHGKGTVSPATTPGTLDHLYANDTTGRYQFLKSGGSYVTRADVGIRGLVYSGAPNPGNLTINYGGIATGLIGPELGFGHVIGDAYDNKVLIVKVGVDGTTLAHSFCPPSSRLGEPEPTTSSQKGFYYKEILRLVADAKNSLGATPHEIAGLGWHQGWNDRVTPAYSAAYETNMANFISDIRNDLATPGLPVVIATAAMDSSFGYSEVELAQLKMANAAAYPAFAGNVAVVDTRVNYEDLEFWQSVALSPANEGYHWNRNGKTYLHIGMAMGDALSLITPNRIPYRIRSQGSSAGTTLSWKNGTEMPTSVRVLRNGVEIAAAAPVNPPTFVDATAPVGVSTYELQFAMPGNPAQNLTVSHNSGITGLQASDRVNGIRLTWKNNLAYSAIRVKRGATVIAASLPGNTSTFVDNSAPAGPATYTVEPTDSGSTPAEVQITVSGAPRGTAVIYEPFDMAAGTTLNGKPGGIGIDGVWDSGTDVQVTSGSFTYGTLPTYGNRIVRTSSNGTVHIKIGPSLAEAGLLNHGAELWFSFLCPNPNNINVNPLLVIGNDVASSGTTIANSGNAIGIRLIQGKTVQSSVFIGGGVVATSATQATLANNDLALVVGRIIWGANPEAVDTIEVYTPGTDLVLDTPQSTSAVVDQATFNILSTWGNGTAPNFDEIRFGATYADVVGQGVDTSGDLTPPTPSPMTFATAPVAVSDSSITMTATTASDANGVQYRFHNTTLDTYGAWQDSPVFTATGLSATTSYSFTVQARDKSVNQNTTEPSAPLSATTLVPDVTAPPTPGFASGPTAISATAISMTATAVTDPEGGPVQYRFHNTTLGTNSGWLSGTTYTFNGLLPSTSYSFTVQARDTAAVPNESAPSAPSSTSTLSPTNGTWAFDADGTWSDSSKWVGGIIAVGPGATASFTANLTANRIISLSDSRTVGNITFTDSTTASNDLTLSGANTLTLDVPSGSPVIDVTQSGRSLTIASVLAGTKGLQKNGVGRLALLASNTYTGTTSVTAGMLDLGSVSPAGIGGGSGRNITLSGGAAVLRTALDNAFLQRLVENSNEFTVMTGSTSNSLDFSSSTGANLPNAFLGNWAGNGAKCEYSGTLTPAADAYRLGGRGSNGLLAIIGGNKLTGGRGLFVGGNGSTSRVELAAANDFTGDTVINAGARLALGNNLALQNSILNVGSAGGSFSLASGILSGDATGNARADNPTFGGLSGSRNLATVFSEAASNNEQSLKAYQMLGLTFNTAPAASPAYSGVIANFARDTALVKTGDGTQELSGSNTFTGTVTVSGGTLKIGHANALGKGGSAGSSSGATIISGGTLDLNGVSGVTEPIILNGNGFGGNGALVNNSGTPVSLSSGLASLQLTSGGTYSSVPTVTISGGGGSGATATATLGVTNATISSVTSGGTGWAVGDQFTVNGGGGSGAVFQVLSVNSGAIVSWNVVHAGTGYTSSPTGITRLTGNGAGTTTLVFNNSNFTVSGLTLTNAGSGYTSAPTVSFGSGAATAVAQMSSVTLASASAIGGSGNLTLGVPVSQSGGAQGLTKVGAGTLTFGGTAYTYTGATSVNQGTLALTGGSQASPLTVASGASLAFTLGSPTVSSASVTLGAGHTIRISGTVDNSSDYLLMTASSFTGTPVLHTPITGYALQVQNGGTTLSLVRATNTYAAWTAGPFAGTLGNTAAEVDFDGGSLPTGIERVLGGDPTSAADDASLAPSLSSADPSDFVFSFRRSDAAHADPATTITVQYGLSLDAGSWTSATHGVNGVTIDDSAVPAPGFRTVVVRLPKALATSGKLFTRLRVETSP